MANVYDGKSDGAKFYPATNMAEDRFTQPAHTMAHKIKCKNGGSQPSVLKSCAIFWPAGTHAGTTLYT